MIITKGQAKAILLSTKGKYFGASFIKKTNGEVRNMVARLGVTKNLKGVGLKYNPDTKGLLIVHEMSTNSYKSISLDSLIKITVKGIVYHVKS